MILNRHLWQCYEYVKDVTISSNYVKKNSLKQLTFMPYKQTLYFLETLIKKATYVKL